jgi:hypothetical protein
MRCYFNLVSSDQTITDHEGLEVTDVEEARTLGVSQTLARGAGWAVPDPSFTLC